MAKEQERLIKLEPAPDLVWYRQEGTKVTKDSWGLSWRKYYKAAELTGKIDFGCNFKNGKCRNYEREGSPMCCCKSCASEGGYLEVTSAAGAKVAKRLWDPKTGFWRKGPGCILPRRYRSLICLFWNCSFFSIFIEPLQALMEKGSQVKSFSRALRAVEDGLRAEGFIKE